jgi:hypothetical protein
MPPKGAAITLVGIDALVEGFMADPGQTLHLEEAGDLFRTPLLGKPGPGKGPGGRIDAAGVGGVARMRATANRWACLGR